MGGHAHSPVTGAAVVHGAVIGGVAVLAAMNVLPALLDADVTRYVEIATGPRPWTGQAVEFPPGSTAMIFAVGRWGGASAAVLVAVNVVLDLSTAFVVRHGWGDRAAGRYLLLSAPLLPLTLFRVDHLSVLLAVIALVLVQRGAHAWGGLAFGVAILTKLWPAALLGALRDRPRTVVVAVLSTLAGLAAWVYVGGQDALGQVLGYRGATGWHVESLAGSVIRPFSNGAIDLSGGAWRFGHAPAAARITSAVLGVAVLLRAQRLDGPTWRALVLVVAVLLLSPLFSLQYMIWIVPLAAILPDDARGRRARGLVGIGVALTMMLAVFYNELLHGTALAQGTVLLRNAVILGVLAIGLTATPRPEASPVRSGGGEGA